MFFIKSKVFFYKIVKKSIFLDKIVILWFNLHETNLETNQFAKADITLTTMSTKKILVIEDNQKHLADAKAFFAGKPEYQVDYAETGRNGVHSLIGGKETNASLLWLKNNGYIKVQHVGVITDIFMPWELPNFSLEVPAGFTIAKLCNDLGIPVVMNTSANHHGKNFQWMNELVPIMGFDRDQLVDSDYVSSILPIGEASNQAWDTYLETGEFPLKNWARALEVLEIQMNKPKS